MKIERFTVGPFQTNCYVVSTDEQVLLIDPACSSAYEQQMVMNYINRLSPSNSHLSILATHGHLDHLWGAKWATEQWHTPVYIHEADIPMVKGMQQQYDMFGIPRQAESFPTEGLSKFNSEISNFRILHTPGHTPGCVCLYWPEEKVLLSGDTLFQMGYGRTDLPGGNFAQLVQSLEALFKLPADTRVYPGHGEATTIGQEAR